MEHATDMDDPQGKSKIMDVAANSISKASNQLQVLVGDVLIQSSKAMLHVVNAISLKPSTDMSSTSDCFRIASAANQRVKGRATSHHSEEICEGKNKKP